MPDTRRRGERGPPNGPESALGHGPGSVRPSPPRPLAPPVNVRAAAQRAPLPTDARELPELGPEFWRTIDDGLSTLGIALRPGARRAIDAHARLLLAWNAAINLTALREPRQVAVGHVLDSLTAVPLIRRLTAAPSALDLGSGGGYPGLPLAVALPLDRCALVDSVRKKAAFLAAAASAASEAMAEAGETPPAIEAIAERAEDLADEPEHRGRWQLVLARAVGSVAEVTELALPLLAVGGHVIAWKRDADEGSLRREISQARGVMRLAGGTTADVRPIMGAHRLGLEGHVLVVIRKSRSTPDHFPRPPAERRRALLT